MDRKHFDDLTKINVPLGLLDDDTYNRLRAHDGQIEFRFTDIRKWFEAYAPDWSLHVHYRAKPQPLTKPQVPWEHMADWVQYVARDENGQIWAFDTVPTLGRRTWKYREGDTEDLKALKIDPGTCDWRDSLVKRPEGL